MGEQIDEFREKQGDDRSQFQVRLLDALSQQAQHGQQLFFAVESLSYASGKEDRVRRNEVSITLQMLFESGETIVDHRSEKSTARTQGHQTIGQTMFLHEWLTFDQTF